VAPLGQVACISLINGLLLADSTVDKNDEKWSLGLDYSW
jgi:hypothetical protein